MKLAFLTVTLVFYAAIHYGRCQTIDEILEAAQNSPDNNETAADAIDHPGDSDTVTIELDMELKKEDLERIQTESAVENHGSRLRRKRKARPSKRWTDRTIPYLIIDGFSDPERAEILQAIGEWNDATCLNFRPLEYGDRNYVYFTALSKGCSSYVGMKRGPQSVKLGPGCRQRKIIVHELGHAIGFFHEQSRDDRDNHITINWENIDVDKAHNFRKHSTNSHDIAYDYLSLMHYGQKFFSKNGQPTITTKDSSYQTRIGKADGLSERDVQLANAMYGCVGSRTASAAKPTAPTQCEDKTSRTECLFRRNIGACNRSRARRYCRKTCGYCQ